MPGSSPGMTKRIDRSLSRSPAGLTRGSIILRKKLLRRGWIGACWVNVRFATA